MYAIIQTGGKQSKVQTGAVIEIEKLDAAVGADVVFNEVLAIVGDDGKLVCGTPTIAGATVAGKITDEFRAKKVIAFKMKRRKGYRRTHGHRQDLIRVEIGAIQG